ncbi:hypothetical protein GCM10010424_57890 [Streptomyces lienomycini]
MLPCCRAAAQDPPEGTLRSHMVRQDGTRRDSVYYSLLADEWPSVRDTLLARVAAKERHVTAR